MGIFVLVKKMVDKKTAAAEAAAHSSPEAAGTAPLARGGDSPGMMEFSPTTAYSAGTGGDDDAAYVAASSLARQHYKQKQMMMAEEESRSRSSSSYSGNMSSPDTLVGSGVGGGGGVRRHDLEDGNRSRSNSGPSVPPSPRAGEYGLQVPGNWGEEQPGAFGQPHPGVPIQYTGSTVVGGGGGLAVQNTGDSNMSTSSTLRGKERRLSPPVQSKLRLRTDSE